MQTQIGRTVLVVKSNPETYEFTGNIDEMFLARSVPHPKSNTVVLDLSGLRNINSMGVREWINMMKDWSNVENIQIKDCSVTMMDQFNIVPQMLGRAKLISFQAPYFCTHCDSEETALINCDVHKELLTNKKSPAMSHNCGNIMEFDALEESYFRLFERQL